MSCLILAVFMSVLWHVTCKMRNAADRKRYISTLKQVAKKRTEVGI